MRSEAAATHTPVDLVGDSVDPTIRTRVWTMLSDLYPDGRTAERRRDQRFPYPCLMRVTPALANGTPAPSAEASIAVGKNLSERGMSFYHPAPLPHRRVWVLLESTQGRQAEFLLDLTWCRFTRLGWYESGGRFLSVAEANSH